MAYGSVLTDVVQSSTAATAPTFKDGNGTEVGTLCRAWVNFNGTGTVAIRASFNVSSITDNGTGQYTVNFTTAMTDANYAVAISTGSNASNNQNLTVASRATSNVVMYSYNNSSTLADSDYCGVSIFR